MLQHDLEIPQRKVPPEERENEVARFEQGLLETRRQISAIRAEVAEKLGESEAEIFDAHQLVLEDRALIEEAVDEVANTGYNIEYAFHQVANRYIDAFTQIDDEYIKERVADIRDVTRRLLSNLLGHQEVVLSTAEASNVIIADDLSPTDTARLDRTKLKAIATDGGSRTSHSVIMAR
ncbi:MAG: phosphoenolpyruvate-utilizing N-terminal domain-containing protein, partial [Verrucomicrobiota bacterium]